MRICLALAASTFAFCGYAFAQAGNPAPLPPKRPEVRQSAPAKPEVSPKADGAPRAGTTGAGGPVVALPATAPPLLPVLGGAVCRARLKEMGAAFAEAETPKASSAECIVADAVRLEGVAVAVKAGVDYVKLSAPPLITCDAALAVTDWIQESVAPLARGHFDEALSELGVGGGFECRQRNHQAGAKRSEHSYGRALDVMNFRIGKRLIKVEKTPPDDAKPFLDAVWASGCGRFSTALGPNADAFHETHIHVDLQPRRAESSKFCE